MKSRMFIKLFSLILLSVLSLAGCGVGPAYERPQAVDIPGSYVAQSVLADLPATAPVYDWWRDFGSTELDLLIDEALIASPDLIAAAARVMEADAAFKAARASRLPTVDIGGSAARSKLSLVDFGMDPLYVNSYKTSATMAYEVDLWGRLSANRRSVWAGLLAGEADQKAVRQALITGVVKAWLAAREITQQVELSESTLKSYRKNLEMVLDRYASGTVSSTDIHLARQSVAMAAAQLDQNRQDMLIARYALEILVGRYPSGEAAAEGTDLAVLPELSPIPPGLPADLLKRRPDIITAEMRLISANASIGVSKADLFPRLALTGSSGFTSSLMDQLFTNATSVWGLASSLAMPLLNRGARASQVQVAEARTVQARADYVKTVLAGFRDVESALISDRDQGARRMHLRKSAEYAAKALVVSESRYRSGLDSLLPVLESQRRYFQSRSDLLRAERLYREARVNLILALGGDWDDAPIATVGD